MCLARIAFSTVRSGWLEVVHELIIIDLVATAFALKNKQKRVIIV
jgi:hypothetical protein